MRCKQEEFTEGSIFHIYNKTPKGKKLFKDSSDYIYFLEKYHRYIEDKKISELLFE